jgi:hypothetical protein
MGTRWIAMLPVLLLLFGWTASHPAPAAAQSGDQCEDDACRFILEIRQTQDFGSSGREAQRCTGTTRIGVILPGSGPNSCVEAQAEIDCAGHVQITHRFGEGPDFCPTANVAWKTYCLEDPTLGSGVGDSAGACAWRDYYGQTIRLKVQVPPHRFRVTPYPVGFVAREDPWGVFHPTARLVWEEPPWPQSADSGWRLWTWGGSRGPGAAPFPCGMSEAELLAHQVPAGTACLRLQLWIAPGGFQQDASGMMEAVLLPARLQFPAAGLDAEVAPGREVEINFPYASHPATGQVSEVAFGDRTLPAFNGYFQRGWPVRLRVDKKTVRDVTGTRTICEPLPRARWGEMDCWTDPPVVAPGRRRTETYVARKEWVLEEARDGVLDLTLEPFGRPYAHLHPDRGQVQGPEGKAWWIPLVWRGNIPWLYLPLAVREGQGVVCSDPTCGGYLNRNTP